MLGKRKKMDRNYLSVGFIFRNLEVTQWLFVACLENWVDFGLAQSTKLLEYFFAVTELSALDGVDSFVPHKLLNLASLWSNASIMAGNRVSQSAR